jgi:hypothetical protein
MAQIFKPSANSIAQMGLLSVAFGVPTLWLGIAALSRSPANTKVEVPKNQPVPFSHQHHTWELGIDCRYCHTSVEKSAYAGLPATETCMSCHSQIWTDSPLLEPIRQSYETGTPIVWNLVNKVPDFVHFNHSIHIDRGINCNTCHGAVNQMDITYKGNSFQMAWCLQCHRAPERYLYKDDSPSGKGLTPRQQVFNVYWKLQEFGPDGRFGPDGQRLKDGLTPQEVDLVRGEYNGAEPWDLDNIAKGKKLVSEYGIKVQQLADCSVCHY